MRFDAISQIAGCERMYVMVYTIQVKNLRDTRTNRHPRVRRVESVLRKLAIGTDALFGSSGRVGDERCYVCMHVTEAESNAVTCYSHLGNAVMPRGQFASRLWFGRDRGTACLTRIATERSAVDCSGGYQFKLNGPIGERFERITAMTASRMDAIMKRYTCTYTSNITDRTILVLFLKICAYRVKQVSWNN